MALVAVATTTSGARPYQPLPTTGRLVRGPRAATFAHHHELAQVRHVGPGKVVERRPLTMKITIYGWSTSEASPQTAENPT
jgi:hypothetical protein